MKGKMRKPLAGLKAKVVTFSDILIFLGCNVMLLREA
jgi:hypothetical protein